MEFKKFKDHFHEAFDIKLRMFLSSYTLWREVIVLYVVMAVVDHVNPKDLVKV
jgi:hypothetical protein